MSGFATVHTMASGQVLSYDKCDELLQGRNYKSRKLANNTYLIRDEVDGLTVFKIRLHETDIITIHLDNTQTLTSGGWLTVTTKQRLNEFSHANISQRSGVWYLADGSLFEDGITVDRDGLNVAGAVDAGKYEAKLKRIKKRARTYARDYVAALQAGLIDYPDGGDCWGCYMVRQDGKAPFGTDHLIQHMNEKYYVPSLLVNAGRDAGYRDDQIGLMGIGGQRVFIDPENVIYKYIVKQLQKDL